MKVIYTIGIREQVEAVITLAKSRSRGIASIELTKGEWEEFIGGCAWPGQRDYFIFNGVRVTFDGHFPPGAKT